ncbi:metalloregulator ArsR/SmtB family transcription factor [Vibrio sp. SCSIO 43136]|uniref:metalloregulator ArsR/SmtB family transcription factor n=1 Tax=Vibrio sp. SCSIO 43136 TaxID=2819101 RepID=UPI002076359B|nr:metalloregulator ArsR/SmtB family transcription factor [Vibrio sp. SCSIO 43136]USD67234.1 metalloregulator ArsR/SmtB family transcription factor [Vibrio sp. SCSIO 43136]
MKKRILFICTGNSARSQLAQAVVNRHYGKDFEAFSAGSSPKDVDPRTLETLSAHGYSTEGIYSKSLSEFDDQEFDFMITLCSSAKSECGLLENTKQALSWDISPPKFKEIDDSFAFTLKELEKRIRLFSLVHSPEPQDRLDVTIFNKCMSDNTRLMISAMLHIEKELSVGELCDALQQSQPKISRALAYLRNVGILNDRRQGLWVFYSISKTLPDWALTMLDQMVVAKHIPLQATIKLLNASNRPDIDHSK